MRVVEERYLKRTIEKLNTFALAHRQYSDFYENIESLSIDSLQDLSFQTDFDYFDRLPFVLGVITSIINKPKLSNKTEEVVMRANSVSNFSPEMFNRTMQDTKLWKQKKLAMVPEFVHSYLHEDEIKIYENIFIVTLIDMIDAELKKYNEFYASLVKTFSPQGVTLDSDAVGLAFEKMDNLNRKLRFIKNTYFYKIIHKQCKPLKSVHPTNILLKERAYNLCFKFYRTLITYEDKQDSLADLKSYYLALLLKAIKRCGFTLKESQSPRCIEQGKFSFCEQRFTSKQFDLILSPCDIEAGFRLVVLHNYADKDTLNRSEHLLLVSAESGFGDVVLSDKKKAEFTTVAALSLWNLAYIKTEATPVFDNLFDEQALADCWLQAKISHIQASDRLYSSFCPVCRTRNTEFENGCYVCGDCGIRYAFYTGKNKQSYIWFLNLTGEDSFAQRYPAKKITLLVKDKKVCLWKIKQYLKIQTWKHRTTK